MPLVEFFSNNYFMAHEWITARDLGLREDNRIIWQTYTAKLRSSLLDYKMRRIFSVVFEPNMVLHPLRGVQGSISLRGFATLEEVVVKKGFNS